MDPQQFSLQRLNASQLETLVAWAAAEGWNPGPHDAAAFWQADPDGFCGFFHQGRLIAGGAIVSYAGAFGFMGLFIVHPDFRAQGIGQRLWGLRRDALLDRLSPDAAIGMDGVVAMQPFYQKGGFELAFTSVRYECRGRQADVAAAIRRLTRDAHPAVQAYDRACLGYAREAFLQAWLQLPDSHAFLQWEGDRLLGYAVLRKAGVGYKIGPLLADTADVAESLFRACLREAGNASVFVDVPGPNAAAVAMVGRYDGTAVFECGRMYHGSPPAMDVSRVFGITTFELG